MQPQQSDMGQRDDTNRADGLRARHGISEGDLATHRTTLVRLASPTPRRSRWVLSDPVVLPHLDVQQRR